MTNTRTGEAPLNSAVQRIGERVREDIAILSFLAALLISRIVTADRDSYWLDELISVYESGSATSSFRESMGKVIAEQVHPPLYEAVLYFWMQIFGASENSTRGLSSVFMALAALALYYLVKSQWSRLPAFFASAGMSLTAGISEYAIESRNYAQLTFLTVLSALIVFKYLESIRGDEASSSRSTLWWLVGLGAVNTSLLLTHYYSVFWLATQGLFVLALTLTVKRARLSRLAQTIGVGYLLPGALFAGVWGWVLLRAINRQSDRFAAESGPSQTPWEILLGGIVAPNISGGAFWETAVAALAVSVTAFALFVTIRHRVTFPSRSWSLIFLGHWLITPTVFVWLGYRVLGAEIYNPRYFIYALPPLIPLIVVGLWSALEYFTKSQVTRTTVFTTVNGVLIATLLLPATSLALHRDRGDYRGVAKEVVAYVEADPDNSYLVLSTNRGKFSLINYYFGQYSDTIISEGSFPLYEDGGNDFDIIRKDLDVLTSHDYVVVIFTFDGASLYPNLLGQLDTLFVRDETRLDSQSRGFVVWSVGAS